MAVTCCRHLLYITCNLDRPPFVNMLNIKAKRNCIKQHAKKIQNRAQERFLFTLNGFKFLKHLESKTSQFEIVNTQFRVEKSLVYLLQTTKQFYKIPILNFGGPHRRLRPAKLANRSARTERYNKPAYEYLDNRTQVSTAPELPRTFLVNLLINRIHWV